MHSNLVYPLYFLLRMVVQPLFLLVSSGIDLESMSIVQRDALLVFRTLCKVGSLTLVLALWLISCRTLLILPTLSMADGYEGR